MEKYNFRTIGPKDALLIIDPQNDFCSFGALPVKGGEEIMRDINDISYDFQQAGGTIVVTQDWHPYNHSSFASQNKGKNPFDTIEMDYGEQTLWADHCIQGTLGAQFHADVESAVNRANLILRKGMNPLVDSYSAFYENDQETSTGLAGYLKERDIQRVFLCGLAYDFCVGYSALDAAMELFETFVLKDVAKSIDLNGSVEAMENDFDKAGIAIMKYRGEK